MWKLFGGKKETLTERMTVFWQWFAQNEDTLLQFSTNRDKVFNMLGKELAKVHELTFEFGPNENGKQAFVVSADGIVAEFPKVAALCKLAPDLPRWNIMPFRQRKEPGGKIMTHNLTIDFENCYFTHGEPENGTMDVTIYMKDFSQENFHAFGTAGFLFLDASLGEFCVATQVGEIDFALLTDAIKSDKNARPLSQLPVVFDELLPTNTDYNLNGNWTGFYKYPVDNASAPNKEFKIQAQLTCGSNFLEGSMTDDSGKQSNVVGYVRGPIIVFEKTYDPSGKGAVLYRGRVGSDGRTLDGRWELRDGSNHLIGPWQLRRDP